MNPLILNVIFRIIDKLLDKAEERDAWKQAIEKRLELLDSRANSSSQLRKTYRELQERARTRQV